ncbi:hypothetical protein Tel_11130 [Candidatus Tenderia electrophaga]|uniref:Uncharacterized protein n=1 Tax=Candidatus Tenderia electrophaga TaxID=1748243 RepID=A0A0S2TES0_9GAMM|nr:hypothetical protein Tel_11130 [Candidatus Tenderia electrophaga]
MIRIISRILSTVDFNDMRTWMFTLFDFFNDLSSFYCWSTPDFICFISSTGAVIITNYLGHSLILCRLMLRIRNRGFQVRIYEHCIRVTTAPATITSPIK